MQSLLANKSFLKILFYTSLIVSTYLLLAPSLPVSNGFDIPYLDKLEHTIVFAGLMILALLSYPLHRIRLTLLILFYALLTEFLQEKLTETRQGDFFDFLADFFGMVMGHFIMFVGEKKKLNSHGN